MYVDELRFGRSVSGVDRAEKKKSTSFLRSDTRLSAKPNDLLVVEPVLYLILYFFSFFFSSPILLIDTIFVPTETTALSAAARRFHYIYTFNTPL